MLTVPDNTLVTRSRSRERGRGGEVLQEEKQRGASPSPSPASRGLRQVAVALEHPEPGFAASGANLELLFLPSNLKSSPRSRSRGGNGDLLPVRRSPRRNPSPRVKKVVFKTRSTVLSVGGTEKEVCDFETLLVTVLVLWHFVTFYDSLFFCDPNFASFIAGVAGWSRGRQQTEIP